MTEMMLGESQEKGRLLAAAIKIIEKLSINDLADVDDGEEDENIINIKNLIVQSRTLTNDRWWERLTK
jgi:hypothetical protein